MTQLKNSSVENLTKLQCSNIKNSPFHKHQTGFQKSIKMKKNYHLYVYHLTKIEMGYHKSMTIEQKIESCHNPHKTKPEKV